MPSSRSSALAFCRPEVPGWRPAVGISLVIWAGFVQSCSPRATQRDQASSPRTVETVRYQDLIVEPAGRAHAFDDTTGIQHCSDESYLGVAIAPDGRPRPRNRYSVELAGSSSLLIGGCVETLPPGGGASVRVTVAGADGASDPHELALPDRTWRTEEQPLRLPAGRARVELVAGPGTAAIALRDLALKTVTEEAPPRPARRAILISLDTFREDAIGAIGGRTRTPVLDRLLLAAQRFAPHWSADISTKPSHATILSGLPVAVHGCDRDQTILGESVETLAERLHAAGIATGGLLSIAPFFDARYGMSQGFDTWKLGAWTAAQELRAASNWVGAHRDEAFFLFVHLYAAHSDSKRLPYEAPGVTRQTIAERFGVADYGCRGGACASRFLHRLDARLLPGIPQDRDILRFLYERGVEGLDSDLGVFFDDLGRDGLWDDTLVLLTADHGEQFAEHGHFLHTTSHEETLRVPLLVKWPGGRDAGALAGRPSSSLDLAPTLLAHFGVPSPDLLGHDLARPVDGPVVLVARDAVRVGDLKLVIDTPEFPESLYDLANDPDEATSILGGNTSSAARLREARAAFLAEARRRLGRVTRPQRVPYSPEEIERLRSLGYLQ
ncbi:MAG: sulfatase [Acidobacteriota bacterium]